MKIVNVRPPYPQFGDNVVAAPEYNFFFEGWIRSVFRDGDGEQYVVIEVRHTRSIFHVAPLKSVLRVTEHDHSTQLQRYDEANV